MKEKIEVIKVLMAWVIFFYLFFWWLPAGNSKIAGILFLGAFVGFIIGLGVGSDKQ